MTTQIEEWRLIIESLDRNLSRAQYGIAIYSTSRDETGKVIKQIASKLNPSDEDYLNRLQIFNHLDLINQQDAVLSICRMMDIDKRTRSFSKLASVAKNKESCLINLAKSQYLNADKDPVHKHLQNTLVAEQKEQIKAFIRLENTLRGSTHYKTIKLLRDKKLAHSSKELITSKTSIDMAIKCLNDLEELLHLAYLIFLMTGYNTRTNFDYASEDAKKFWELFVS